MAPQRRHLGIDYGSRRIGVAVSDPLNLIARGIRVVMNSDASVDEIKRIADEFNVATIVVGMPLNLKGEKGKKAREVDEFIGHLEAETGVNIVRWDERFSSRQAQRTLREMGVGRKKRQSKEAIDEMAAAIILQSYLDSGKFRRIMA